MVPILLIIQELIYLLQAECLQYLPLAIQLYI